MSISGTPDQFKIRVFNFKFKYLLEHKQTNKTLNIKH